MAWNPPLSRESKLGRGLSHPECSKLLCPIDVDWDDEMYVVTLQSNLIIQSGLTASMFWLNSARNRFRVELQPAMKATRWPALLYENYKADPNNLAKGFMRSDIMVRVSDY